jgi:hypothetical protein
VVFLFIEMPVLWRKIAQIHWDLPEGLGQSLGHLPVILVFHAKPFGNQAWHGFIC